MLTSVDIIIVGAGLVGLEIASCLKGAGLKIALVEAGPLVSLTHVNEDSASSSHAWEDPDSDPYFERPWISQSKHYSRGSGLRSRVGGRSLYWYGVCLPIERQVLSASWPKALSNELVGSGEFGYEATCRAIGVARSSASGAFAGEAVIPTPRAITTRASGGWAAYSALNRCDDIQTMLLDSRKSGLSLYPSSRVIRIVVSGGRAKGIEIESRSSGDSLLRGRIVILAAGALESARLADQARKDAGLDGGIEEQRVSDHVVSGLSWLAHPSADLDHLESQTSWMFPSKEDDFVNTFLELRRHHSGLILVDVRLVSAQPTAQGGRLSFVSVENSALSQVSIDTPNEQAYEALLNRQWSRLIEIASNCNAEISPALTAGPDGPRVPSAPTQVTDLDFRQPMTARYWSRLLGTEDHEGCCLPIGQVVDESCALIGVEGAYVAGPAVFPEMGRANPALTALTLARRLSGLLLEPRMRVL